jgi:hypothetical protein
MTLDMKQRKTLARVDDETRQHKVKTAREIIYQKNYAVDSKAVKAVLNPQSLASTSVGATRLLAGT